MEYIFTNLPKYIRVTPRSEFANSVVEPNHLLLFSEDGITVTGKRPDGSYETIGGGTDVSDTTATAADVRIGKDFYLASGVKTTGTMSGGATDFYKCASVNPGFFYRVSSAGTTACNGDYYDTGIKVNDYPLYSCTNNNQTWYLFFVPAQYWVIHTEYQGIFSNLSETVYYISNSGITGNWSVAIGDEQAPVVTRETAATTWTGYKAVLSGGVYTFESTVTSGLTYGSGFTPEVGEIYADGALEKASLWQGIWVGNLMNAPMDSNHTTDGHSLITFSGDVTYNVTSDGITGAVIQYGSVKFPLNAIPSNFTLSGRVKATSVYNSSLLALGRDGANSMASIWLENGALRIEYASGGTSSIQAVTPENWHHYALTKSGNTFTLYVDGVPVITDTNPNNNIADQHVYISGMSDGSYPVYTVEEAYYSYVRLYDYALSAAEIAQLAGEFTPSAA